MNKLSYITLSLAFGLTLFSCTKTDDPSIIVDKTEIEAEFGGMQETIGVKCNRDWSATTDVDWITMSHAAEDAFEAPSYILVTVLANSGDVRTGTITIASKTDGLRAEVTVRQGENGEIIRTADRFVEYLRLVREGKATDGYRLGADIDLSGRTLPEILEMNYAFDGQNHIISNWTSSSSLFGKVGAKGKVENLTLAASCTLTIPEGAENFGFIATENQGALRNIVNEASASASALSSGYKGMICGVNSGTMSGCVNKGSLTARSASVMTGNLFVAGVVGANTDKAQLSSSTNNGNISVSLAGSNSIAVAAGVVGASECKLEGCANTGAVTLACESSEGKADGGFKAVSVAGVAGVVSLSSGSVASCSNTGDVTFRAGYTLGVQAYGKITKFASNVAGIVGAAYKCPVSGCENSGKLVSYVADLGNASSVYQTTARQSVGGIVSSPWGKVSGCTNKGLIDIDWVTATHNAGLAKNFVGQAGGIVGGDYNSDTVSSSVESCANEGDIDIVFDASQSNSTFGGITGWGGKEAAAGVNVIKGCENRGSLTLDGFSKARIGGISGCQVKIEDCKNYKTVYLKGGHASSTVGGIAGFGNFHNITGCENYGDVRSDVKLAGAESSAAGGLGGLVGAVGNTAMEFSGCKVDCSVIAPEGSAASMLVGVIGHNKSGGKAFAVGTAAAPDKIKGSFNGVALTADNYQTYMRRPGFTLVNKSVTFNVEYLK